MKKIAILLAVVFAASAWSQTYVQPYVRKDGTYVEGHHRTAPDQSLTNNYGSQGNFNPYTGQQGTIDPYKAQPNYVPTPPPVYTAPRCFIAQNGQYICR